MDTPTTDEIRSAFAQFIERIDRLIAALEKLAERDLSPVPVVDAKPAPPTLEAESVEVAATPTRSITYDQMREAINLVRDRRSHSVAVAILKQFCPEKTVPHMKAVKPEDYAKVLAACEAA